jgi:Tfp pilus assembly protein PilV
MQQHDSRRGVALMDVLIAALLLGVGLAVTLSMASQALRAEQTGEWRLTASWLADESLAMVVAMGPAAYQQSEPMEGRFRPPFDQFDWTLELNRPSEWEAWNATATVSWQDRGGVMSVSIDTLIAPRQGDEDDPVNWKPDEPLDRESRTWDEEEAQPLEGGGG